MKPRTLILRTAGTNCDVETAYAFEQAGSLPCILHLNRLLEHPAQLGSFQILSIPGGFSYGDDISAGRIFANQLKYHLREPLLRFVEAGKPVIGICNGFQVLVKAGLLPGMLGGQDGQLCTLTNNDSGRFVDRWIYLSTRSSRCIWTQGLETFALPVAHGEGKLVPADERVRCALWEEKRVTLVYSRSDGSAAGGTHPDNPNGSVDDIAGICDATGLILGLMPHPERYTSAHHHPAWTTRRAAETPEGLRIFRNAVKHACDGIGAGI